MEELCEAAKWLGIMGATYIGSLLAGSIIEAIKYEKVRDQTHLDEIIKDELPRLAIPHRVVGSFISTQMQKEYERTGSHVWSAGFNVPLNEVVPYDQIDGKDTHRVDIINVFEGVLGTRGIVRHELYHSKYHLPTAESRFRRTLEYLFYKEPAAILYSTSGFNIDKHFHSDK